MKKVCFLTSHLLSGASYLYESLDQNPRVQGFRSDRPYTSMLDVLDLTNRKHKLKNAAAIYMDELIYNHWLQTKDAYKHCQFVYMVRPPEGTLNELVSRRLYTPSCAARYYTYRLRRMCEMAKRTPGAVLLTWDDLATGRGLPLVEEYLGLKTPLTVPTMKKGTNTTLVPLKFIKEAEESYERHLSFLYSQKLRFFR